MNSFTNSLKENTNFGITENGAIKHKSTLSAVYDMFALGGAYRNRTEDDCITQFMSALAEKEELAIKCLFYLRDVRGGQGERRYFRVCYKWLAECHPDIALRNIKYIPEFGRWDDLIYSCFDTKCEEKAMEIIKHQLALDTQCKTPSLLAKWCPSENCSSKETKRMGSKLRTYLGLTHKEYRKLLSSLRAKIKIVETLMSQNRWEEIEFDKVPSKAGLIYKNAFARKDIIAKKYEKFLKDDNIKVNAKDLYPYDIIRDARKYFKGYFDASNSCSSVEVPRLALQKMWDNLPDYFDGKPAKILTVIDTSGSMTWSEFSNVVPIDVALSLGIYCAEKNTGAFSDCFITFSSHPELVEIYGQDIFAKAEKIYNNVIVEDTNLEATFDLLKEAAKKADPKDIPETLLIISDMEINQGIGYYGNDVNKKVTTLMEDIRESWEAEGLIMPHLVYWNVNARNDTILDLGDYVTCVSGASPVTFQMVMTGKTGISVCLDKLLSDRYKNIK